MLGCEDDEVPEVFRSILSLSVRKGGAAFRDPTRTADRQHQASMEATLVLVEALQTKSDLSIAQHKEHCWHAKSKAQIAQQTKDAAERKEAIEGVTLAPKRKVLEQAPTNGAWLTATPCTLNGTVLTAGEFRDGLVMRFGLTPMDLPDRCDGCQSPFNELHAFGYKQGGLVVLRHDAIVSEWVSLCVPAFSQPCVTAKPLIKRATRTVETAAKQASEASESTPVCPSGSSGSLTPPDLRGDLGVSGFWSKGKQTIFDVTISDVDAASYGGRAVAKILSEREKAKRTKYEFFCR